MPDDPNPNPAQPNGDASPTERPSLRDIAEASWNEVQDAAPEGDDTSVAEEASGQGKQPRDTLGRFASADQEAQPGEQSKDPAPQIDPASGEPKPVDPAPQDGSSNQPPQHWAEADRQMFGKLPQEGQAFLLRRHTEMERDYSAKTQAAASAVQFTNALAPVFQHPDIAGSLQQANLSPFDAIGQWAGFHLRAIHPDPQVKIGLLRELAQRMGLDPAAPGQNQPGLPGLSEDDLKDPAIRSFADYIGKTQQEVQALRGTLTQLLQQQQSAAAEQVVQVRRSEIDRFADEVDAKGNKTHPHFDNENVMQRMVAYYQSNPRLDLKQAYDEACWATPEIRQQLVAAERNAVTQQQANEKARLAVRGNVRGITSPVSKPAVNGQAKGLRAALEQSADEVGMT